MKELIKTGIKGLNDILNGGIPKGNGVIINGAPGTGKTTLGIQFLYQGAMINEPGLYITFEELPEQIHSDMLSYGIDIQKLEEEDLLKVITLSPETLLREMLEPFGLLEELVQSIGCQRIVIDSLSLIKCFGQDEREIRKSIYSLKNALIRNGLTSLLLVEKTSHNNHISFEDFVFDGVIQLEFTEKFNDYKERTLEVLKMRGTKILEGAHTYRFTDEGIYLIPSHFSGNTASNPSGITTGDSLLDQSLNGGIEKGKIYLLEIDSIAVYKYILVSICSQLVKKDIKFAYLLPNSMTVNDIFKLYKKYDIDLEEYVFNNNGIFTEQYNRTIPSEIAPFVFDVADIDEKEFKTFLLKELKDHVVEDIDKGGEWFWGYDINSIIEKRGEDFVKDVYVEIVTAEKELGITSFVICNIGKIDRKILALLEQKSDAIIKTWVSNKYQYLQVTKSPVGVPSPPYIVENINEKPFFRLL